MKSLLTWEDIKVSTGFHGNQEWRSSDGKLRVHAVLKQCSSVCYTFWTEKWSPEKAETRQALILQLNKRLLKQFKNLQTYINL